MFFLKLNQILMKLAALSNYIPMPVITSPSKFFASEGSEFQLTCHAVVTSHVLYAVAFSHKGHVQKTNDYMTISELQHDEFDKQKASINLTVLQGVKERDEGDYKCIVMDYHNNTNSFEAEVNFVSEPIVTMNAIKSSIEIDKGKKRATFLIEYRAYPPASFKIYNPTNEPISNDMDVMDRIKYDVQIEEDRLKFIIKVPEINDFGEYTIVATTAGQNFTLKVKLIVSGKLTNASPSIRVVIRIFTEKPAVIMEDVYVMAGEEVHMICKVVAYPEADITWSFQPCQDLSLWPSCRKERIQTVSQH